MRLILFFTILVFVTTFATAAPICFENEEQYNEVKDKLPAVFHEQPVFFGAQVWKATVAARVAIINGKVKYDVIAAPVMGKEIVVSDYVKMCIDGMKIKVLYFDGVKEDVKILSDTGLETRGVVLEKKTHAEFAAIEKIIYAKVPTIKHPEELPDAKPADVKPTGVSQ